MCHWADASEKVSETPWHIAARVPELICVGCMTVSQAWCTTYSHHADLNLSTSQTTFVTDACLSSSMPVQLMIRHRHTARFVCLHQPSTLTGCDNSLQHVLPVSDLSCSSTGTDIWDKQTQEGCLKRHSSLVSVSSPLSTMNHYLRLSVNIVLGVVSSVTSYSREGVMMTASPGMPV